MPIRNTMVRHTLFLSVASIWMRTIGMLFQIWLSGHIGAAGIGLVQLIGTVGILAATLGTAGVRVGAMYLIADARGRHASTRTVTACCLPPSHMHKEGSIGLPFPDTYIKIVKPGTEEELPYGEEGEILLAGPTVMKEYMHHPEETAKTLQHHADGLTWVCTGDLGTMDSEGFVYFRGRAKRMIITSGYNVYPAQIENILDAHEFVQMSCVIGVPDSYKMQKVKAFVKLVPGVEKNDETKHAIMEYCRKYVAKYAMPYDIEFRDELPKTLVGKVAYRVLEEEELKKLQEAAPVE